MRAVEDVIYLFDLEENPLKSLPNATNIEVEHILDGIAVMTFTLPLGMKNIVTEQQIVYRNKRYRIAEVEDAKVEQITFITAESLNVELNDVYVEKLNANGIAMQAIAERVLSRSTWKIGTVENDEKVHYMLEENQTALYILRKLANISGYRLEFDTLNRIVHIRSEVGKNLDFVFRYRKNIQEIKKKMFAPRATRMKPLGRGGLTIASVNDGSVYIEDYTWYESIGIDISEAKKRFTKTHVWSDERYIYAGNLMRAGQEKLRELAHPQIAYETEIAYLENDVDIGDYGYVVDEEMGIKVQVRIVRLIEYEDRHSGKVEFNYLIPGLQDQREREGSDGMSDETNMILVKNEKPVTLRNTYQLLHEMSITAFKSTNAQVGVLVVGEATANGLLEGYFQIGNQRLITELKHTYHVGWSTIGMPFVIPQLQDGSHLLQFYVKSSSDFKIDTNQAELYIVANNLLGGMSADIPRADIVDEIVHPTPPMIIDTPHIDMVVPIETAISDTVEWTTQNVYDRLIEIEVGMEREDFARVPHYPDLISPTQSMIDNFIDVTHEKAVSFVLLGVNGQMTLIASDGNIATHLMNQTITSTKDMYLMDVNNSNTNIGKTYVPENGYVKLEVYRRGFV